MPYLCFYSFPGTPSASQKKNSHGEAFHNLFFPLQGWKLLPWLTGLSIRAGDGGFLPAIGVWCAGYEDRMKADIPNFHSTIWFTQLSGNMKYLSISFGKVPKICICPPLFLPVPDRWTVSYFHPCSQFFFLESASQFTQSAHHHSTVLNDGGPPIFFPGEVPPKNFFLNFLRPPRLVVPLWC